MPTMLFMLPTEWHRRFPVRCDRLRGRHSKQLNTIVAAPGAKTPDITWNPPLAIAYGTALGSTQLNAPANVPGTFAYSPAVGMTLKAAKQTLFATFTPTDSKTYSAAT